MNKKLALLFAPLLSCTAVAAETSSTIPLIPVVPAAQAKANLAPPPDAPNEKQNLNPASYKNRSQITMEIGVNEIIEVAVNHLNRIVTPYKSPKVTTASSVTTSVRDNVVYMGTTQETPVTMFITDADNEDEALSLTLIPRKVPPREIFLNLKQGNKTTTFSKEADKWEQSQPYIATLEQAFRDLALGQLPPGYIFEQRPKGDLPACRQTGLSFDFQKGQTATGQNLAIHVGIATNTSPHAIEFIENSCGDWDVAAVSAFPRSVLNPGEKTEVFVAVKRNHQREITVNRPSLLREAK